MADSDFSVKARINADTSNFDKGMKDAQNSATSLSNTFSKLSSKMSAAFAGIGVGTVIAATKKYVDVLKKANEAYKVQAKAEKALENAARNNPYISGEGVKRLKEYAGELQKVSNFGDEVTIDIMAQLASTGRSEAQIMKIMGAAADYAAAKHIDLKTAAETLNMTYSGMSGTLGRQISDVKNLTAEQLKNGDAIDIVAQKYKGFAKESADSATQAKNAYGDFFEAIGELADETFKKMDESSKEFFEGVTEKVKKIKAWSDDMSRTLDFGGMKKAVDAEVKKLATSHFTVKGESEVAMSYDTESLEKLIKELEIRREKQGELYDDEKKALWLLQVELDTRQNIEIVEKREAEARQKQWEQNEAAIKQIQDATKAAEENEKALQEKLRVMEIEAKVQGKTVELQDKYDVYLQSYVDLLTKSNDLIKEGDPIEQKRKKQLEAIKKELEGIGKAEKTAESLSDGFSKSLDKLKNELKDEAESWNDFFDETFGTIQSTGLSAISSIGSALVESEDVWQDMGAVAVESIATILEGLSKELMARAALNASMMNYAGAAAAMAGATAALVGAGALKSVANQMKSVADSAKEADVSIENIKNNFSDILKNTKDFGSFASGFTGLQKTLSSTSGKLTDEMARWSEETRAASKAYNEISDAYKTWRKASAGSKTDDYKTRMNLIETFNKYMDVDLATYKKGNGWLTSTEQDWNWNLREKIGKKNGKDVYKYYWSLGSDLQKYINKEFSDDAKAYAGQVERAQAAYNEALNNMNSYAEQVLTSFKETNQDLIDVINVMDLFLARSNAGDNMGKIIGENIKSGILNSVYDARNNLIGMGSELSNLLFSSISEGSTKSSFLTEMKNYIKESVLKLTVYTEGLAESMSSISQKIISAIYSGDVGLAKTAKNDVKKLWDETKEMAKQAEGFVNEIFDEIEDNAESLVDSVEDMMTNIADEIVNALSEGLGQGDFLETMKNYIRKMVIQTVVYTESLKTEIEAIGKAISTGISEGFTETGLHEIKRDLSYVFDQATRAMDKVDSLFDNVFSGYATGTNNATAGLHLVGEAGPELVRFRGGEQVLNTANTQKALEGSAGSVNNWTVNFNNMQDTSAYVMMEQLKDYRRQMAIDGIF